MFQAADTQSHFDHLCPAGSAEAGKTPLGSGDSAVKDS
jgi:hypothetical protein